MSAVESSDDFCITKLPERPGWRSTSSWIATTRHRLHRQLCAAHGWAAGLDVAEGLSLYHVTAAVISQLVVLATAAEPRHTRQHVGELQETFGKCASRNRDRFKTSAWTLIMKMKALATVGMGPGEAAMTRSVPTIFRAVSAAIIALGTLEANAGQPAELAGVWLNPNANMRVRVGPCGATLCGNVIWMKFPNDPQTGAPLTDRNNPEPENRTRPILGMQLLTDMKPGRAAGEWTGKVYSPNEGKSYDASFSMDGPNDLKMKACIIGLLCRTQTWTRVN